MLERDIQRKVLKYAETIGYNTNTIKMTNEKGFPDAILFYKEHFFLIEFKSPGGRLSKAQVIFVASLYSEHNIPTHIIRDVEKGKQFLYSNKRFIDKYNLKIHDLSLKKYKELYIQNIDEENTMPAQWWVDEGNTMPAQWWVETVET